MIRSQSKKCFRYFIVNVVSESQRRRRPVAVSPPSQRKSGEGVVQAKEKVQRRHRRQRRRREGRFRQERQRHRAGSDGESQRLHFSGDRKG
jgi:hypothetical protein